MWQDIKTAPKDGTRVLLYFPRQDVVIGASYSLVDESDFESGILRWHQWLVDDDLFFEETPETGATHWMILPELPKLEGVNENTF